MNQNISQILWANNKSALHNLLEIPKFQESIDVLESKIGYTFNDKSLLIRALCHKSFCHEAKNFNHYGSYERLEFLGDAIINKIISECIWEKFESANEGSLSKLRALLVSGKQFQEIGKVFDIHYFAIVGQGELNNISENSSICADMVESLIAAIFLDSNESKARDLFLLWVRNWETRNSQTFFDLTRISSYDYRTKFQELVLAKKKVLPQYVLLESNSEQQPYGT